VYATTREPASAYFITPTRIWELGAGALLALAAAPSPGRAGWTSRLSTPARAALAWAGLGAIAVTGLTYTQATPFPGWRALLPVVGTVAVIAAADPEHRLSPRRLLAVRPVQFLGDISYSVYLWHWPLVVLLPHVSGGSLGILDKSVILVVSLVLAWGSKVWVEDRFRGAVHHVPVRRSFQLAAVGMAVVVGLGGLQLAEAAQRGATARRQLAAALAGDAPCFGAAAMAAASGACPTTASTAVVPTAAQAPDDKSEAYARNCFEPAPFAGVRRCVFGDPQGKVSIALVGNSHAGHWLPALQKVAAQRHWKITTFLASECTANKTPAVWDAKVKQTGCRRWADRVLAQTASRDFDLVVTSERNGRAAAGHSYADSYPAWLAGYRQVVAGWMKAGTDVLVLHDTATPGATLKSVPDCLAAHEDDVAACSGPRAAWVPKDPLAAAARAADSPRVQVADLNDYLCDADTCPAVIGGVTVYSDASHLTKTYAITLAPYLRPKLLAVLERARS
jgi:hypothetical protein